MTRLLYRYRNSGWVATLIWHYEKERTGRVLLGLIPNIYDAERKIRITSW